MDWTSGYYLELNETSPRAANTSYWTTAPTASVFTVKDASSVNATDGMIAYCAYSVPGFSKIGQYIGNLDADGPMVYTDFRPAYVMLKHMDSGDSWPIADRLRSSSGFGSNMNGGIARLRANTTGVEDDADRIIFLANGFKIIVNYAESNASAGKYLYWAIADVPFKNSLAY